MNFLETSERVVFAMKLSQNDFLKLVKAIVDYKLFHNDSTVNLIKESQCLQDA